MKKYNYDKNGVNMLYLGINEKILVYRNDINNNFQQDLRVLCLTNHLFN